MNKLLLTFPSIRTLSACFPSGPLPAWQEELEAISDLREYANGLCSLGCEQRPDPWDGDRWYYGGFPPESVDRLYVPDFLRIWNTLTWSLLQESGRIGALAGLLKADRELPEPEIATHEYYDRFFGAFVSDSPPAECLLQVGDMEHKERRVGEEKAREEAIKRGARLIRARLDTPLGTVWFYSVINNRDLEPWMELVEVCHGR